jgi:hypothetical protein
VLLRVPQRPEHARRRHGAAQVVGQQQGEGARVVEPLLGALRDDLGIDAEAAAGVAGAQDHAVAVEHAPAARLETHGEVLLVARLGAPARAVHELQLPEAAEQRREEQQQEPEQEVHPEAPHLQQRLAELADGDGARERERARAHRAASPASGSPASGSPASGSRASGAASAGGSQGGHSAPRRSAARTSGGALSYSAKSARGARAVAMAIESRRIVRSRRSSRRSSRHASAS